MNEQTIDQDGVDQDRFERELHEDYLADLAVLPPVSEEERRRVFTLAAYRCPDHGCDLEEKREPDGDETGVWTVTTFWCPVGRHEFGSAHDQVGGYWPVEEAT